jgi:hypothetical protein
MLAVTQGVAQNLLDAPSARRQLRGCSIRPGGIVVAVSPRDALRS